MSQRRILGACLILFGVLFVLSLASHSAIDWPQSSNPQVENWCGRFGAYVSAGTFFFFGQAAWLLSMVFFAFGYLWARAPGDIELPDKKDKQIFLSSVLLLICVSGMLYLLRPVQGGPGGTFGMWLNHRLQYIFGTVGTPLIFLFLGFLGVIGLLPSNVLQAARQRLWAAPGRLCAKLAQGWDRYSAARDARRARRGPIPVAASLAPPSAVTPPNSPGYAAAQDSAAVQMPFAQKTIPFPMPRPVEIGSPPPKAASPNVVRVAAERDMRISPEEKEFQNGLSKYRLPPLELLKWPPETDGGIDQKHLQGAGQILEDTLKNFGIDAQVVQIVPGPTVTLYEVLPAAGVAVSRIAAREADLKLALAANYLRIVAPIPGKSVVGVEVPNANPQIVKIRELLAFEKFTPGSFTLPFALGKDIMGKTVITDLQKMPHVLIAGATGSGKSVCVASLLMTLLYRLNPAELRLILIDPKRVELSMFSEIPHLLSPPILEAKSATRAFKWLMVEMDNRYNILSDSGTKNLESYNAEQSKLGLPPMPYIVLVVDELADLMLGADGRSIEDAITRLAQMSRAVGIHLVLATQRPSVDVITGLIKANMPARIAFQVASQFDARTILDAKGAESLIGRGDMLYLSPNASKPVRLQGAYVDEEELRRVIDFIRGQMRPMYVDFDAVPEGMMLAVDGDVSRAIAENTEDIDPQMYEEAKRFTIMSRKGSTSNLQRKFRIGFNKATKIIEMLEKEGIVGPNKGPTPRDVLVGPPIHAQEDPKGRG